MVLWIVLGIAALPVVLFVAVLILPVVFAGEVSGGSDTGLGYRGSVMGFGGIAGVAVERDGAAHLVSVMLGKLRVMRFRIEPDGVETKKDRPEKKKKTRDKKVKPQVSLKDRFTGGIAQFKRYWPRVKRVYHDIWYVAHIDRFTGRVTFGFADPALTGKLIGAIAVINRLLPEPFSIDQSFDFTRRVIRGGLDVRVTVRPDRFWRRLVTYIPLLWSIYRERRHKTRRMTDGLIVQEGV